MNIGPKILELAADFGIQTQGIYAQFANAVEVIRTNPAITHLLLGHLGKTAPVIDMGLLGCGQNSGQEKKLIFYAEYGENEADILAELESYLTR